MSEGEESNDQMETNDTNDSVSKMRKKMEASRNYNNLIFFSFFL